MATQLPADFEGTSPVPHSRYDGEFMRELIAHIENLGRQRMARTLATDPAPGSSETGTTDRTQPSNRSVPRSCSRQRF